MLSDYSKRYPDTRPLGQYPVPILASDEVVYDVVEHAGKCLILTSKRLSLFDTSTGEDTLVNTMTGKGYISAAKSDKGLRYIAVAGGSVCFGVLSNAGTVDNNPLSRYIGSPKMISADTFGILFLKPKNAVVMYDFDTTMSSGDGEVWLSQLKEVALADGCEFSPCLQTGGVVGYYVTAYYAMSNSNLQGNVLTGEQPTAVKLSTLQANISKASQELMGKTVTCVNSVRYPTGLTNCLEVSEPGVFNGTLNTKCTDGLVLQDGSVLCWGGTKHMERRSEFVERFSPLMPFFSGEAAPIKLTVLDF